MVDLATTSQSEADEKRGRDMRKRDERLGKLERRYAQEYSDCKTGDRKACAQARATYDEMQQSMLAGPPPPEARTD